MTDADRRRNAEARAAVRATRRLLALMADLRASVEARNKNGK